MTANTNLWVARGHTFDTAERLVIMGVLNVTPDSFSDGGTHTDVDSAVRAAEQMLADGADIIDVGGESTRPGRAETVTADEERSRVVPVIAGILARFPQACVSVDTYKGDVAAAALDAGASIINDITALRRSPEIASYVADAGAGLVLMHMQGTPETMQQQPSYQNVLVEVKDFLRAQLESARSMGVEEQCIAVDPGIGFGKTDEHNLQLLAGLEYLRLLQRPILVGASRKGFLGRLAKIENPRDRVHATIAAHSVGVLHGAGILRAHDVKAAREAAAVLDGVRQFL